MLKRTEQKILLAAFGAISFGTATSSAIEASDILLFNVGPVSLRPQFNLDEQYNDNIYYRGVDRIDDFITIVSPGIKLQVGDALPDANKVSIQYTLNQLFYLENSDQNATQHRFATDFRYSTGRTTLTGKDNIDFLSSVLGGGFGINGRKVDRLVVADTYRLDYSISSKTGVYGQVEHTLTDFEDGVSLFDRQRLEGTLGFEWRYTDRTIFFGEGFYGMGIMSDNAVGVEPPDSRFIGGFLGVRGDFTDRLRGRLKLGYENREFEGSQSGEGGPAVDASISFQFTERLSSSLSYNRRQEASVQFTRVAYVADTVSLQASQIVGATGRMRINATTSYSRLDYDPSPPVFVDRVDSQITAELSATYFFQTWLATRLAYSFDKFESSLPGTTVVDYTANRVTLSLAIGF